jgi:hypothetical protein
MPPPFGAGAVARSRSCRCRGDDAGWNRNRVGPLYLCGVAEGDVGCADQRPDAGRYLGHHHRISPPPRL